MVHTNFGGNSYGPITGPYLFLGRFVWTNSPESSSKIFRLHWHWSMDGSSRPVHYSLSKFRGEWFTNRSNHIHIFTPITRIVATKVSQGPLGMKELTDCSIELGSHPPLRGVSRALWARNPPKSLRKSLPGPSAPGSKKCPKQSQKSLRSLKTVYFESPEILSRLFRTLLGPWGRKAPGDSFGDSSGISCPKGPETPVRGGWDPNSKSGSSGRG